MSHEEYSIRKKKHKLRNILAYILNYSGISYQDFIRCRSPEAIKARSQVCVVAQELLAPRMSSVEIALHLKLPRTTYLYSIQKWRRQNEYDTDE